jgi:hypothetical protein
MGLHTLYASAVPHLPSVLARVMFYGYRHCPPDLRRTCLRDDGHLALGLEGVGEVPEVRLGPCQRREGGSRFG